jgi:hypothetical protein
MHEHTGIVRLFARYYRLATTDRHGEVKTFDEFQGHWTDWCDERAVRVDECDSGWGAIYLAADDGPLGVES